MANADKPTTYIHSQDVLFKAFEKTSEVLRVKAVGDGSSLSSTLYDGTQSITVAAALNSGTSLAVTEVIVQADPDNTDSVFIGNATSQSIELLPGAVYAMPISNVNKLYAKAKSGTQTVNWHARD